MNSTQKKQEETGHCTACDEVKPGSEMVYKANGKITRLCKRCNRAKAAGWRTQYPDRYKASLLRYFFGLDYEVYLSMLESQASGCAICDYVWDGKDRALAVDHCHETGEVRALLCRKCNSGLGFFNDDPKTLASALGYLLEHKENGD